MRLMRSATTCSLAAPNWSIEATVTDGAGHTASATRTVPVIPDPPPTLNIVAPAGTELIEGQIVQFVADATDNVFVYYVGFTVDGAYLANDFDAPYKQVYTVPVGITSLLLEVTATDDLGHVSVASRTFTVVPDPGTTVNGRVIDTAQQPVADAAVSVFGQFTAQTAADGTFSVANVPTVRGTIVAHVTATLDGKPAANASLPKDPVAAGVTDLGDTTLSILPTAPTFANADDYTGDYIPDLIVGYPDRQSLIYQFDYSAGQFVPSTTHVLPYGAVSSGATLTNFGQLHRVFTQGAGQPGSVTDLVFRFGQMQLPVPLTTGLSQESGYMAAGRDTGTGGGSEQTGLVLSSSSEPGDVLALLNTTGDTLTVRYRTGPAIVNDIVLGSDSGAAASVSSSAADNDEFDDETEYTAPVVVPLNASTPLRSMKLADVTGDGLVDILAIRQVAGSDARLVVIPRASATSFGAPIESPITTRSTNPDKAVSDFSIGVVSGDFITYIYVLGDDRVRLYESNGSGAYVPDGEIMLPRQIPTGITDGDLNYDSLTDVVVTTQNTSAPDAPDAKSVHVFMRTQEGNFEPPMTRTYTAPANSGDTRIVLGQWDGSYSADVVVVDGETVLYFRDVGPISPSS